MNATTMLQPEQMNDKKIIIMQTAEKLFAEYGYGGTSIRMITTACRMNPAMIYYYFRSKMHKRSFFTV